MNLEPTTHTIAFKTFGCKANSTDTDALHLEARKYGFKVVEETTPADAYVINSCTVTANADRDARLSAVRFKRQNPSALVGVVGCYSQVAKDELLAISDIDVVLGTANKFRVLSEMRSRLETKTPEPLRDLVEPAKGFLPETFEGSRYARATIKIQDGCNFKCSFCIIPSARGRSRSLSVETVLAQILEAKAQGFREVILTGIHLAHYGWDLGTDLEALIRHVLEIPDGPRVRLSTLDPFEMPDSLLGLVQGHPKFCPHFHIALQSGSDTILKSMRRFYKASEFVEVTNKIGKRDPNTFIGVDVIVGFPGETEEEFQKTVQILRDSYWAKLHVFSFSVRAGTAAEALPDKVPNRIIHERSEMLRGLSDARLNQFLNSQVGREVDVLLEQPAKHRSGIWQGHTENYLPTYSISDAPRTKEIIRSVITKVEKDRVHTTPLVIAKAQPEAIPGLVASTDGIASPCGLVMTKSGASA